MKVAESRELLQGTKSERDRGGKVKKATKVSQKRCGRAVKTRTRKKSRRSQHKKPYKAFGLRRLLTTIQKLDGIIYQ